MIRGELFNQDMIKAFLEDRKGRTSRPIKPRPICYGPNITFKPHNDDFFLSAEKGWLRCRTCGNDPQWSAEGKDTVHYYTPKHRTGDVIYARETFREVGWDDNGDVYDFKADGDDNELPWTPSIHMPREAARLWFKVTDVKIQKLDDMTEQDAVDDGFKYRGWSPTFNDPDSGGDGECETPLDQFQDFWLKQYGDNQSWMWVYYLQPIAKEEAQNEQ